MNKTLQEERKIFDVKGAASRLHEEFCVTDRGKLAAIAGRLKRRG